MPGTEAMEIQPIDTDPINEIPASQPAEEPHPHYKRENRNMTLQTETANNIRQNGKKSNEVADFAELTQRIRERGLLERQPGYYALKMVSTGAMLALSITVLLTVDNTWLQLANAAFLAFVFGQIGYIGHDAGHLAIYRSARNNRIIGYAASALINVSQSWWINQHNQHHRTPNNLDEDPHTLIPVLVFSEERAKRLRGIIRRTTAYQAFYFIPLLTMEAMSMRWASTLFLAGRHRPSSWPIEATFMALHTALYCSLLIYALGPWQALAFALVHQAIFGIYYGMIFAPNHKGMLILDDDNPLDFVRTQVLTTRNVRPNPVSDFLYGGLNYQIEHHLFTMMPRNQLGRARPIVREFCRERGIPYYETSSLRSYREILTHMHEVSSVLRKRPALAASNQA